MKLFVRGFVIVGFLAMLLGIQAVTGTAYAGPASTYPFEVTQPDGSKLTLYQKGDEFQSWTETEDGYSVIYNDATGTWEYAEKGRDGMLEPSGIAVDPNSPRPKNIKPHLKPKRNKDAEMEFKKMLDEVRKENKKNHESNKSK